MTHSTWMALREASTESSAMVSEQPASVSHRMDGKAPHDGEWSPRQWSSCQGETSVSALNTAILQSLVTVA